MFDFATWRATKQNFETFKPYMFVIIYLHISIKFEMIKTIIKKMHKTNIK
jgi:hypothetical protein